MNGLKLELILPGLFKEKGIRFIAINDHYDTLTADGSETHIVMPIKALTNDNFPGIFPRRYDPVRKSRWKKGILLVPLQCMVTGSLLENKNVLIPDEYAAGIVKEIFADRLKGLSASAIAQKLNDAGILSPAEYKKETGTEIFYQFSGSRNIKVVRTDCNQDSER